MSLPVALAAAFATVTVASLMALGFSQRRSRLLSGEMDRLASRLDEMERATAHLAMQVEVAESVLLDKGIADPQDLETARRGVEARVSPGYVAERDGELH